MNGLEAVILGYLHKWCRGVDGARPQATIAQHLQMLGLAQTSARDVRDAIAALRLEGWPVGTSPAGCFLCIEARDFRVAYRNLYGRLGPKLTNSRILEFYEAEARLEAYQERPLFAALEREPGGGGRSKVCARSNGDRIADARKNARVLAKSWR